MRNNRILRIGMMATASTLLMFSFSGLKQSFKRVFVASQYYSHFSNARASKNDGRVTSTEALVLNPDQTYRPIVVAVMETREDSSSSISKDGRDWVESKIKNELDNLTSAITEKTFIQSKTSVSSGDTQDGTHTLNKGENLLSSSETMGVAQLTSINEDRVGHLREHCKRVSSGPKTLGARFFIPHLRTWYCSIDKCASTTWRYVFSKLSQRNCTYSSMTNIHLCAKEFHLHGIANVESRVSLITVRNPWRRLVSAYIDKVAYHVTSFAESCYVHFSLDYRTAVSPLTFTQLVKCILFQIKSNQTVDGHFSLQSSLCPFCERALASGLIIAKVETLESDLHYFMHVVGVTDELQLQTARNLLVNSPRRDNEKENQTERQYRALYESLDEETFHDLLSWMRPDCEMFQYPLNPFQNE